jgi:hypothetical protein
LPSCATHLLFSALLLGAWPAFALDALRVTLPESCPSEAHFRARLSALSAGRTAPIEGSVSIAAEADGYRLQVDTPDVSRTLRHASCARLVESAAVIVALGASAAEEAPPEPPPPPSPPPAKPVLQDAPPPPPLKERAIHPGGWLEVCGVYGLVPGFSLRPAAGVLVRGARLGGAFAAGYTLPQSTSGSAGVRVHGPGASLLATALLHARVHAAAGTDVHLLLGSGRGLARQRSALIPLWMGRLELVVWPLVFEPISLGIVVAGAVPFQRHSFLYGDGGTAFRPRPYQLFAGLRFAFGS